MSNPITIREVTLRHCRMPQTFRGSYTGGEQDPAGLHSLFVSISDGKEIGHGECNATSLLYEFGHIGRSNLDEWKALLDLCAALPGQDARKLSHLVPDSMRSCDANSIVDAVDFALHDLVGRRAGLPVAALLGGIAKPWVWGMPVVHTQTPDAMAERAADWYRRYGFRYYKVKPIGTRETDVETLRKVRECTGPQVRFYMDANYGLKMTPDEVISYIKELYEYGLEVYEDPIDTDWATYRYIRERIPARLMLDEKVRTPESIMEIVRERCAGQVNIHANWAGGFSPAIFKASLAALGGMPTMIGSTHYLGPGAAAYQILASVLPGDAPCEQLYMEVYGMQSAIPDPYEIREGKIFIRQAPGLGVHPDMTAIEKLTVRKEKIS
ncbi:MAG: mandelate racemase/muconate lactonizing enzyme family protein [Armatimonadetes bacterium]|nr:mandelate racemase/muconate lactonizing enzyme family protein [Armatimonadota bacterium]